MGYGRFTELFDAADPSPTERWAAALLNFLLDLEGRNRFPPNVFAGLVVHLVGLINISVHCRPE